MESEKDISHSTINRLASEDVGDVLEKYFKDVAVTKIDLLPPTKLVPSSENLWRVGGARVARKNPLFSSRGVLTILLDRNYEKIKNSEGYRGVLIDLQGNELDIWSIKSKVAKNAIADELLAPEDQENEAIQVEFAVRDENTVSIENVEDVVYQKGLALFILRVNEEKQFEVVTNSQSAFQIPPAPLLLE